MKIVSIHTTTNTENKAKIIAKKLIHEKYAACVHIMPIQSTYFWQNNIVDDKEFSINITTTENMIGRIEETIKLLSGYELPQFLVFESKYTSDEYEKWVFDMVKN